MPKRLSKGERVVKALPEWEGTPFRPHANVKQAGCDCKGLLWGVAAELKFKEAKSEYAVTLDYNLGKRSGIPSERLREGFAKLFDRVDDIGAGDILLLNWNGKPGHIAIADGGERAWNSLPDSGVRKRTLRALFHRFPLDSIWRWRGK
jgi:hypothetical protein